MIGKMVWFNGTFLRFRVRTRFFLTRGKVSLFTSQAIPIRRIALTPANPCYWDIRTNSVHLSLSIEIKSPETLCFGPLVRSK